MAGCRLVLLQLQLNMEALVLSSALRNFRFNPARRLSPRSNVVHDKKRINLIHDRRRTTTIAAVTDASLAAEPTHVEITWQIVVGGIAGVTPFVVAGIEFSKRIIAQRRCKECGGSGLVLRDDDYFRCPECGDGGFLPWQSWRRFFWG